MKYGGDNFRLKACFTWDNSQTTGQDPSGWNACVGGDVADPNVLTVWRKAWLWQTQMTPNFNPLADRIRGAFDDGFVEVVMRSLDTGTPYQSPLSSCSVTRTWAHNSGTYPYNQMLNGSAVPPRPSVWCPNGISPDANPPIKDFLEADIPKWKLFSAIHELGHVIGYGNFPDDVDLCGGGPTVMRYPPFPAKGGDAPTTFYFCENQISNGTYGLRVATELK